MRADRRVRSAAGAALLALLGTACGGGAEHRSDADLVVEAAVRVEAHGCGDHRSAGVGSFVADHRVLTVAHVVAGADEVEIVLPDGAEHEATVVAIDRSKDLAVLHVGIAGIPLPVGSGTHTGARGSLATWRHDGFAAEPFTVESVRRIQTTDIDHQGDGDRRGYVVEARVDQGDSGSLLVSDGEAVGVLFARSTSQRGRAYATDIAEAAPLLAIDGDTPVDLGACAGP